MQDRAATSYDFKEEGSMPAMFPRLQGSRTVGADDLLPRRMRGLHFDVDEFARAEPFAFRELQRFCALCESYRECERELADEFADPGWQNWRDYCPNATTLSVLSTLQVCASDRS